MKVNLKENTLVQNASGLIIINTLAKAFIHDSVIWGIGTRGGVGADNLV